jgi:hypothetical protein
MHFLMAPDTRARTSSLPPCVAVCLWNHISLTNLRLQFYRLMRDFVLGNDQTGLVTSSDQPAIGGENSVLEQGIIPGQPGIVYGTATAPLTTTWPEATVAAFLEHAGISSITFSTGGPTITPTATAKGKHKNAATRLGSHSQTIISFVSLIPALVLLMLL